MQRIEQRVSEIVTDFKNRKDNKKNLEAAKNIVDELIRYYQLYESDYEGPHDDNHIYIPFKDDFGQRPTGPDDLKNNPEICISKRMGITPAVALMVIDLLAKENFRITDQKPGRLEDNYKC